ncbi:MAG: DUF4349 domain-containing protein [Steroidobacter sp.]
MMAAQAGGGSSAQTRSDTLAYEHTVWIELNRDVVPTRLREIESACTSNQPAECTVLEVTLNGQEDVFSGTIRMRIAPQGVDPTIETASQGGKLTSRSTRAEDLAQPIADTQRRLALLTTHRDRLAEFMKSKDIKVEQLIAVSKELATAQTEIDSLGAEQAQLRRRVDTNVLTIHLSPPQSDYAARRSPIKDALKFFGSNFREAVGQVIEFIAVLLPWLVIVLPGLFLVRAFWAWIGRKLAKRSATSS